MHPLHITQVDSPISTITLVVDGSELVALDFAGYEQRMERFLAQRYGTFVLEDAGDRHGYGQRLRAYLGGDLAALDAIPVQTVGTAFQTQVWQGLRSIPPGEVLTYGVLAARLGRPTAARAVGLANSRNPIAIVLPCHRVVGANAALTGYAGGLNRKAWLLQHERRWASSNQKGAYDEAH